MKRLDSILLAFFQRQSDRFTDWFGWNCFTLARSGIYCHALATAFTMFFGPMRTGEFDWFCPVAWIFNLWFPLKVVARIESEITPPHRNTAEISLWFPRYGILCLAIASTIASGLVLCSGTRPPYLVESWSNDWEFAYRAATQVGMVAFVSAIYWLCCTPRPPQQIFQSSTVANAGH